MSHGRRCLAVLALLVLAPAAAAAPEPLPGVRVVEAFPGVSFVSPTWVGDAGDGTDLVYVAEQGGKVLRLPKWRGQGPVTPPQTWLDLSAKVTTKGQGGIGALAFHPSFRQNGRFFVSYTAPSGPQFKVVLAEYRAPGGVCDPASERVLLEIPKSRPLHNGGGILFGPDGKLWMGTGDNAAEAEAVGTSQNPASLLGKVLRLDVDAQSPGLPYGIPSDNPWAAAGQGVRPEIWAYGFRNAWRFCFDAQGALWVASPGSTTQEWLHKVVRGGNHGWPFYEGSKPNANQPIPAQFQGQRMEMPNWEYAKEPGETGTTAHVGAVFYRGTRIPALRGMYVCADYGRTDVYGVTISGDRGVAVRLLGQVPSPSSVGQDSQGELLISSFEGGKVYTLAP